MLDLKKLLTKILKNTPEIRTGVGSLGSVPANSYKDVAVQFGSAMKGQPIVITELVSESTSPTLGSFTLSAISMSENGFTARVFNNTSTARSPGYRYVAFYGGGVLHNLNNLTCRKVVGAC